MSVLSENIKWCRTTLGLSQTAFAIAIGLKSYTAVWEWENEKGKPMEANLRSLARLIGLPEEEWGLFYGVTLSKHRWKGKSKITKKEKKNG